MKKILLIAVMVVASVGFVSGHNEAVQGKAVIENVQNDQKQACKTDSVMPQTQQGGCQQMQKRFCCCCCCHSHHQQVKPQCSEDDANKPTTLPMKEPIKIMDVKDLPKKK